MIVSKDINQTRFGVYKTNMCPWKGTITMAKDFFDVVWG
jgi:hypothetical protein